MKYIITLAADYDCQNTVFSIETTDSPDQIRAYLEPILNECSELLLFWHNNSYGVDTTTKDKAEKAFEKADEMFVELGGHKMHAMQFIYCGNSVKPYTIRTPDEYFEAVRPQHHWGILWKDRSV